MSCVGLVGFNYNYEKDVPKSIPKQDKMGSIGAFLCKPLILACGSEVTVRSSESGLTFITSEKRNMIQRLFFAFVAIALLPLTLIGLMCLGCSKAYSSTAELYKKNGVTPEIGSKTESKTAAAVSTTLSTESVLASAINDNFLETLERAENFPGLKSDEFKPLKAEISKKWAELLKDGVIEVSGIDKDYRPSFVTIQGIVEQVLASELGKSIKSFKGIIHTPMPATPLCAKGDPSGLVNPDIAANPASLATVKARTTILRDFLFKGNELKAGELYIIYPKKGFQERTEEQRKIYSDELAKYKNLFNCPLDCESIPEELIGATYLFQDQAGTTFAFAIKMIQAKNPKDPNEIGNFGLWFGPANHPSIQKRIQAVSQGISSFIPDKGINAEKLFQ